MLGCCVQRTGGACLRKLLLLPRLAVLSLSVSVSFSFANICLGTQSNGLEAETLQTELRSIRHGTDPLGVHIRPRGITALSQQNRPRARCLHVPDVITKTFPHPDRQPDRLLNKLGSNERLLYFFTERRGIGVGTR